MIEDTSVDVNVASSIERFLEDDNLEEISPIVSTAGAYRGPRRFSGNSLASLLLHASIFRVFNHIIQTVHAI